MNRATVPIVLAGTVETSNSFPSVNIEYHDAAVDAVNRLIKNGHKRIAFVSGSIDSTITKLYKVSGYERALNEASIEIDTDLIVGVNNTYDDGLVAWDQLRELKDPPTAFFAGNDEIAIGLIHGAQDNGLRVPEDIEVMSFENSKLTRMVRPQLTSVVLPLYDIGAVSMRLLTKHMNKENIEENNVILPYWIEERKSVK